MKRAITKEGKNMKTNYIVEKFIVTKSNVNGFVIVNKRNTRMAQVHKILRALNDDTHFEAPFVVNRRDKKIRVIDGHHRIEAMKKFYEMDGNEDEQIEIVMATYKNLTDEEERDMYTKWNIAIRQNTHDFINSYKETIPMFERLTSELPCTIYGTKTKIRIKNLTEAWFVSQISTSFQGGVSWTNYVFVENMQNLTDADIDEIKDTFSIMWEIFNPYSYTDFVGMSPFKTTPFIAIFSIIQRNKKRLSLDYMKKRMKTKLASRSQLLSSYNQGGRKACQLAHEKFLSELNEDALKKFI